MSGQRPCALRDARGLAIDRRHGPQMNRQRRRTLQIVVIAYFKRILKLRFILLLRLFIGRRISQRYSIRLPRQKADRRLRVGQLHRVPAPRRQHKNLGLLVHVLRQKRNSITGRGPPRRPHTKPLPRHHAHFPGRNIHQVDFRVPAIILEVSPADVDSNRLAVRGELRIGDAHKLRQIICGKPASLGRNVDGKQRRRHSQREGEGKLLQRSGSVARICGAR